MWTGGPATGAAGSKEDGHSHSAEHLPRGDVGPERGSVKRGPYLGGAWVLLLVKQGPVTSVQLRRVPGILLPCVKRE